MVRRSNGVAIFDTRNEGEMEEEKGGSSLRRMVVFQSPSQPQYNPATRYQPTAKN